MEEERKALNEGSEQEDPTEKLVERIVEEINTEDETIRSMEEQIHLHKTRMLQRIGLGVGIALALVIGMYLLIVLQTYTKVRVLKVYSGKSTENSQFQGFANGILKYSRDGVSFLNLQGKERWNHSFQFGTPVLSTSDKSGVVADKGGNDIIVLQEEGIKGSIQTDSPIEKVSVSNQGVVVAVLTQDRGAKIVCYDREGSVLAEVKSSMGRTGYPLDVAISENGELLQVLYLKTGEGKLSTEIVYYNFGPGGKKEEGYVVERKVYEDRVFATGFFFDGTTSAVVGDQGFSIFKGNEVPREIVTVSMKEKIRSVFYNEKYLGFVLQNAKGRGYELRLYNTAGNQILSKSFSQEYSKVKLEDSQILLYDGKKCSIFSKNGVQKFRGEFQNEIQEVFSIAGVNKYMVIDAKGIQEIRLVK